MSDHHLNDAATVAFLPRLGAAVRLGAAATALGTVVPATAATAPFVKDPAIGTGVMARWGGDNREPDHLLDDIRGNTILGPTLDWKARALYGGGLMYGSVQYGDNGAETFKPTRLPEIEQFIRRNQLGKWARGTALDVVTFNLAFPELILSKDRRQVTTLTRQKAPHCRWATQNPNTGLVESCFINANWARGATDSDEYTTRVPVILPGYDLVESLREDKRGFKFIYPGLSYPGYDETYYPTPPWTAVRTSLWVNVAKEIPKFKKALFENQVSLKYLIEVSTWWWKWKYGENWETKPLEERKKLMNEELQRFESFMVGSEAAGNSLMVTFHSDPVTQKEYAGWKITPIDNKIKDGIYIEDSQETSLHLYSGLDVDPTLRGISPGKSMGGGSGSDKRVAFNVYLSLQQAFQDTVTDVLDFITAYNNWVDADGLPLVWRFRNALITTLDTGSETKVPTQTPTPQP